MIVKIDSMIGKKVFIEDTFSFWAGDNAEILDMNRDGVLFRVRKKTKFLPWDKVRYITINKRQGD